MKKKEFMKRVYEILQNRESKANHFISCTDDFQEYAMIHFRDHSVNVNRPFYSCVLSDRPGLGLEARLGVTLF